MKQRFLNQKLGKRTSRRQELMKTKNLSSKRGPAFPPQPSK
jgi:hypothetical protein